MTQREEFEAWWEEFSSAHEDWRFADSDALRWATWQAAQAAQPSQYGSPESHGQTAYKMAKALADHLAVTPVEPNQALVVEPVYQYQLANGNWIDQTKESYDYNVKHGQATVRMLYATPQAAAQPPAPSEAAREYMTDYSDGREWAGATSQALEPTEAQLVTGVKAMRLFVTKNSIKDFRDGFIAAINAKERAAHGIKQGGQHD